MQKWEYCVVGPIKQSGMWEGAFPKLIFLNSDGRKMMRIEGSKTMLEGEALAATIARLGMDGWEMVGTGAVGESTCHFLYFKRPIP